MQDSRKIMYFHPYDIDSYKLVKEIVKRKLSARIDMVPAIEPEVFDSSILWSLPSMYGYDGRPLAFSPLTPGEVMDIVVDNWREGAYVMSDDELFISTIVKSPFASAIAIVHGSYKPLITKCSFVEGALRLKLRKIKCNDILNNLLEKSEKLFEESWRTIGISIAYTLARDYYIGNGFYGDPIDLERLNSRLVTTWIIAKASIGKAGIPIKNINKEYIDYITNYINSMAEKILDTVEYEITTILTDRKYMNEIEKEIRWFLPHHAES